jgi:hypothetical protein
MSVLTGNIWSRHFLLIVFAGLPNDATCKQLYRNNKLAHKNSEVFPDCWECIYLCMYIPHSKRLISLITSSGIWLIFF